MPKNISRDRLLASSLSSHEPINRSIVTFNKIINIVTTSMIGKTLGFATVAPAVITNKPANGRERGEVGQSIRETNQVKRAGD